MRNGLLMFMGLVGLSLKRLPLSAAMVYLAIGFALGPTGTGLLSLQLPGDVIHLRTIERREIVQRGPRAELMPVVPWMLAAISTSVVLHGITATPLIRRYGRDTAPQRLTDSVDMRGHLPIVTRARVDEGAFLSTGSQVDRVALLDACDSATSWRGTEYPRTLVAGIPPIASEPATVDPGQTSGEAL